MMLERAALVLILIGVGLGTYVVGTRWQAARIRRQDAGSELLEALRPGIPAVIYFWSAGCAPCELAQKPALERLQQELGPDGVQVLAVNALEQPDVADGWGVLSLPTTFIVDGSGQPRRVNHGVARAEQLRQQIQMLEDERKAERMQQAASLRDDVLFAAAERDEAEKR